MKPVLSRLKMDIFLYSTKVMWKILVKMLIKTQDQMMTIGGLVLN
jgi:hypothetical protein